MYLQLVPYPILESGTRTTVKNYYESKSRILNATASHLHMMEKAYSQAGTTERSELFTLSQVDILNLITLSC